MFPIKIAWIAFLGNTNHFQTHPIWPWWSCLVYKLYLYIYILYYSPPLSPIESLCYPWVSFVSIPLGYPISRHTIGEVTADVISYSSCIAACGQGQRWADAMAFLNEMREEQLQWNIIAAGIQGSGWILLCSSGWSIIELMFQEDVRFTLQESNMFWYIHGHFTVLSLQLWDPATEPRLWALLWAFVKRPADGLLASWDSSLGDGFMEGTDFP